MLRTVSFRTSGIVCRSRGFWGGEGCGVVGGGVLDGGEGEGDVDVDVEGLGCFS